MESKLNNFETENCSGIRTLSNRQIKVGHFQSLMRFPLKPIYEMNKKFLKHAQNKKFSEINLLLLNSNYKYFLHERKTWTNFSRNCKLKKTTEENSFEKSWEKWVVSRKHKKFWFVFWKKIKIKYMSVSTPAVHWLKRKIPGFSRVSVYEKKSEKK